MRDFKDLLKSSYDDGYSISPTLTGLILQSTFLSKDEKQRLLEGCINRVFSTISDVVVEGDPGRFLQSPRSPAELDDAIWSLGGKYAMSKNRIFEVWQTLLCAIRNVMEENYKMASINLNGCAWLIEIHFTDGRLSRHSFIEFQNNLLEEILSR